jgi:hypothetical protein
VSIRRLALGVVVENGFVLYDGGYYNVSHKSAVKVIKMPHASHTPTRHQTKSHNKWLDKFDETFPYPQEFFDVRQEISPAGPWPLIRVLSIFLYCGLMGFGIWFLYKSFTDTTAITTVSITFLTPKDSPGYYCTMLNRYTGQYLPLEDDSSQHITYINTLDTYESCLEKLTEAQPCEKSLTVQSKHMSQGDPYPLNGKAGGAVLDSEGNLIFGSTGNGPYYYDFNSGGVGPDPHAATVTSIGSGTGSTVMARHGSTFYYVDSTGKIVYQVTYYYAIAISPPPLPPLLQATNSTFFYYTGRSWIYHCGGGLYEHIDHSGYGPG